MWNELSSVKIMQYKIMSFEIARLWWFAFLGLAAAEEVAIGADGSLHVAQMPKERTDLTRRDICHCTRRTSGACVLPLSSSDQRSQIYGTPEEGTLSGALAELLLESGFGSRPPISAALAEARTLIDRAAAVAGQHSLEFELLRARTALLLADAGGGALATEPIVRLRFQI